MTIFQKKKSNLKGHWPQGDLWPHFCWGHLWLYPRIIVSKSHKIYVKVCSEPFFFSKTWIKGHCPLDDLWPQVCWGRMCDSTQGSLCKVSHENTLCGYRDPFLKTLNERSLDPYMTFDPTSVAVTCVTLPKDHCVRVPWEYVNVCGYSDQFCKTSTKITTYNIHTTYRMSDHIVSFWTKFRLN